MNNTINKDYVPRPKSNDQTLLTIGNEAFEHFFGLMEGNNGLLNPEALRNISPLELLVVEVFGNWSQRHIERVKKAAAELPPYDPMRRYVPTAEETAKWAAQKNDEW